ncbi:N-acetyltransferase [Roseobacter denitrificans]|uniref:Acetyltransferase, GNAT family protein, putative n=1 Tax=Roseobacter denitrificans (strain ATCC 33942 / OCh 114) TaxID=375451 RepID=Q16DW1_ROSDO|nr:GNAT family N-acetyltransferase [Roseobacter denitrificans]ABG29832.1 acetyltransferase, GNAT family protein, putative [Roseobacter denitrificans OCh 114]AVL53053.1 N-acetyltransferase [Roseobacter denitrificans]SFG26208.1 Acetyltransferase (GNAT) domain-containing protein [Roseobacter denitrificans OCh 114]
MRDDIILSPITQTQHREDALDLAMRATDYATLEVGHAPDGAYIRDFFTAVPPGLGPDCLMHFGVMEGPAMVGMICIAEGYEFPDDWWIGLVLLDPAFRGQGVGHKVVSDIKTRARNRRINLLKLAVLAANPRALKFWHREGFTHHRDAPATPQSDGHDRIVLKYQL